MKTTEMRDFWGRRFLGLELLACLALSVVAIVWAQRYGGYAHVDSVLTGNRAAVYGTVASILGALLGFVITTVSIVIAFSNEPSLSIVRDSTAYPVLWRVFVSGIRWLGVATAACLLALLFHRDSATSPYALYICFGTVLVAIARLMRSVWILERVIAIVTKRQG